MGFFESEDEYDEPDWREHQEEEATAWHRILEGEGNQDAEWDEPLSESELLLHQGDVAPSAIQGQSELRTGSPSRSRETPKASVDMSPLRRRLSETGSPVRLPIEGLTTQPTQDDPYLLPCPLPDCSEESAKRLAEEESSFETPEKMRRLRAKTTPSSSSNGPAACVEEPFTGTCDHQQSARAHEACEAEGLFCGTHAGSCPQS